MWEVVVLTPISVTKRQLEHLTAGAPKGYINSVSHWPQYTLPTWCSAKKEKKVKQSLKDKKVHR